MNRTKYVKHIPKKKTSKILKHSKIELNLIYQNFFGRIFV